VQQLAVDMHKLGLWNQQHRLREWPAAPQPCHGRMSLPAVSCKPVAAGILVPPIVLVVLHNIMSTSAMGRAVHC
jgi:hypothetical protein